MKPITVPHVTLLFLVFFSCQTWSLSITHPVTFDDDTLGLYTEEDFYKDWAIKPTDSSGQGSRLYIVSREDNSSDHVLRVTYLANAFGGQSAMTFTAPLGGDYTHLIFQYDVKFSGDFTWVKGGKLPGLTSSPYSPTGCISNDDFDGFSARYMWREEGLLEGYIYNPDKVETCGDYYASNPIFYFTQGVWYTLKQEIYVGDPGVDNGYIKAWVNGLQVLDITNILLRKSPDIFIDEAKIDTFFGGSDNNWAPSTDQYAYFDQFNISIEENHAVF
jgi:hypothetical protein